MNLLRIAALGAAGVLIAGNLAADGKVGKDCTFNGKKLYGKVQVVQSFGDIKIRQVSSFPDLNVQVVTSFPDSCGKWQFVNSFADLKVQFVSSFPDIDVRYVQSFPGIP